MSKELSACHQASVTVGGDNSDPLGGTHYYLCNQCGSPCDLYTPPDQPEDELRELLADVRFNDEPGIDGLLGANMESKYFEQLLQLFQAQQAKAVQDARLQMRLHVLSILKAEADRTFGNVKQLIYTEHQKAWDELKKAQPTQPPAADTTKQGEEE